MYGGTLLALLVLAPSQTKELVALPLSEDGVKPPAGLDAWKVVTAELKRASGRLGMSVALQKKRHDFLIGPAREQARDCRANTECLSEIGAALGADVLIAGTIDPTGVALIAIEVKTGKRLASARSSKRLSATPLKRQATVAARALVETIAKSAGVALAAKEEAEEPEKEEPELDLKVETDPSDAVALPREGELYIARDQLAGVTEVRVDGESLSFSGDGSMSWKGAPGHHSLIAERSDGNRLTQQFAIDPGKTTEVRLDFPMAAVRAPEPATATAEVPREQDGVFTTWWFWTSIGVAVAAGATTAAVLASGAKGGPNLEGDTGTIRGRY